MEQQIYAPLVAFRGTRTYVHSTTLYEHLMQGARSLGLQISGPVEMRINQLIRKQPRFCFAEGPALGDLEQHAIISFHQRNTPWHCFISERDQHVDQREAYDEMPIRKNAIVEGQTIRLDGKVDAKPFEIVTSLTLQLHNALFSIPSDRKWFLTRFELERVLLGEDSDRLQITMAKKTGTRLTRCVIRSGAVAIGTVDFMLGNLE